MHHREPGGPRRAKRGSTACDRLTRNVVIRTTDGPGDAEAQTERAVEQGFTTIVAAGGDGTINEVVNGIGSAPVALGILPMGTVNVLAMELGIPFDLVSAWKVIRAGKIRLIDEASANGHLFVQMAGIGLDAQIVERNNRQIKKVLGPLSYLLTATTGRRRKAAPAARHQRGPSHGARAPSFWSATAGSTADRSRSSRKPTCRTACSTSTCSST